MCNDKKKKMLDKVKKLLNLSSSPNKNEAILAASRAKEILDKYNLSMTDIDTPEIEENVYDTGSIKINNWMAYLANGISDSFNCKLYVVSGVRKTSWNPKGKNAKLVFVGSDLDLEIVNYVFNYLRTTINTMVVNYDRSLGKTSTNKKRLKNSYVLGLVVEINKKIEEFAKKDEENISEEVGATGKTGKELILIKKDAVAEYMDNMNLKKRSRGGSKVNSEAFNKGSDDGKNVNINRGVCNTGTAPKRIGA